MFEECALGWKSCRDEQPCPLHNSWKPMRESLRNYLSETSVADLVTLETTGSILGTRRR